jgi:hypothetical protein
MDSTMITKKLYNKSVQWMFEAEKDKQDIKTYYDKIADVKPLKAMEGDPHIMTSAVGPRFFEELNEKAPIKFVDPVEGWTVYVKRKDYALGSECSMKLNDDMSYVGIENFFKKYIQEIVQKGAEPTIDNEFAKLFLYGGYTAGHTVFDNSTKALATGYTLFVYDGKPFYSLTGTAHTKKGHATTYINSLANALTWDNAQTADVLFRSTNAVSENGAQLDMTDGLAVIVPPALGDKARVIFNTDRDPSTANNGINPLKGRYEIIENPYLAAAPTAWYLQKKKAGIVMFVDKTPQIRFWVEESTRVLRCSAVITMGMAVTSVAFSEGNNCAVS